jgi:dTDP-4-amino-4,6-dideoxygalactose transaminase
MAKLQKGGVATRPGTHAVHVQKYYAQKYGIAPDEFPQALLADRLALALPLFPQMTDSDQERVVNALTEV